MHTFTTVLLTVFLFQSGADAQNPAEKAETPAPDLKQTSYLLGQQYGEGLSRDSIEIDLDEFIVGFKDGLASKNKLDKETTQKLMTQLRQYAMEKARVRREREMTENKEKAEKFLAENQKKSGVQTLESGIQFRVIKEGDGAKPTLDSRVKVHYRGSLMDGTEFDSSYKRNQPAEFGLRGVIQGWQKALVEMPAGSKWEVFIPADLGYGSRGTPNIPPNSLLIFEIELLEIK